MGKRATSLQQQKGKPGSTKALFLRAADKLRRETVEWAEKIIRERLRELGLEAKDKAGTFTMPGSFYYLRKKFILTETGKIILRLHPKAMAEERETLRNLKRLMDAGE
ncbi:MAG: hypothetical protein II010_06190, partial [Oscillospiraceae bacterium]|nr:hypothetical protein [Oscillospiraceae bacterium]